MVDFNKKLNETPITSFTQRWASLSNFYPVQIQLDNIVYPSVEHAYQAAKTDSEPARRAIRDCSTAGKAKRLGRDILLRDGWDEIKVSIMAMLLRRKFPMIEHNGLTATLLETGTRELIEGNDWGDRFWGMTKDVNTGEWVGENWLGKLLMDRRQEIRLS